MFTNTYFNLKGWYIHYNQTRPTNLPLVHKLHFLQQRLPVPTSEKYCSPHPKTIPQLCSSHHPVADLLSITVQINFPFNFSPNSLASPVNIKSPQSQNTSVESEAPSRPNNLSCCKNNRTVAFFSCFHQFLLKVSLQAVKTIISSSSYRDASGLG